MISVLAEKDIKILIPNKEHKNFTETNEIIPSGTIVSGEYRNVRGLRRGEPFTYRLFITNQGKLIYIENLKTMNTEVNLGADSALSTTGVNFLPAEESHAYKYYGVVGGAIAGFAYSKLKKQTAKQTLMFAGAGALLGYGIAYIFNRNKKGVIITPSK